MSDSEPSVVLCGVPPKTPHPTEFSVDGTTYPKCGATGEGVGVEHGFGLMGGGYGAYELCCSCDWFAKREAVE